MLRFMGFNWLRLQLDLNLSRSKAVSKLNADHVSQIQSVEEAKDRNARALELYEAVRLAARAHPIKADCLPKSLVLVRMLEARGFKAQVALGVAKNQSELASHAWVEIFSAGAWSMVGEPESVTAEFSRL